MKPLILATTAINDFNAVMKALNEASGTTSDAAKTDSGYKK